jgi:hypothetical protein
MILICIQIKSLFRRLAANDKGESVMENELIDDYNNVESESALQDAFEAVITAQKKKKN